MKDIINQIVWYIPFKKLRNNIRLFLLKLIELLENKKYPDDFYRHENYYFLNYFKEKLEDKNFFNIEIYKKLIKNLDEDSIGTINKIISKIQKMNYNEDTFFDKTEISKIMPIIREHRSKIIKINDRCYSFNGYFLPFDMFSIDIFSDKFKFDILNRNKGYLKNKNIIDAGAFIGDTAIIFSNYTNKNVYSFEPLSGNYKLLLETIDLNQKINIIPSQLALSNKEGYAVISSYASELAGGSSINRIVGDFKETIKVNTLDNFVKENGIKEIGLIKIDIEGSEEDFLLGAENTIKKQKPILFISIYHNPKHFFYIKLLLESWQLGYEFKIIKPMEASVLIETTLICEAEQSRAEQSRAEQSMHNI